MFIVCLVKVSEIRLVFLIIFFLIIYSHYLRLREVTLMHVQRGSSQQFKQSENKDKTQQQRDNSCNVCQRATLREGWQLQDFFLIIFGFFFLFLVF